AAVGLPGGTHGGEPRADVAIRGAATSVPSLAIGGEFGARHEEAGIGEEVAHEEQLARPAGASRSAREPAAACRRARDRHARAHRRRGARPRVACPSRHRRRRGRPAATPAPAPRPPPARAKAGGGPPPPRPRPGGRPGPPGPPRSFQPRRWARTYSSRKRPSGTSNDPSASRLVAMLAARTLPASFFASPSA